MAKVKKALECIVYQELDLRDLRDFLNSLDDDVVPESINLTLSSAILYNKLIRKYLYK